MVIATSMPADAAKCTAAGRVSSMSFSSSSRTSYREIARHLKRCNNTSSICAAGVPKRIQSGSSDFLFSQGLLLTLERSVGSSQRRDEALWDLPQFQAQVFPDLPVASSWQGLLAAALHRPQAPHPNVLNTTANPPSLQAPGLAEFATGHRWSVLTVGAQARSKDEIRRRILSATGRPCDNQVGDDVPADALLLVSGSHPVRRLPGVSRLFSTSFDLLNLAQTMRRQGDIPSHVSLWAVENPLTNGAARLEQKVEAGAEVVLTQPPLSWGCFETWMEDVNRRGLAEQVKVVVGMPMITSSKNLAFWITLSNAWGVPGSMEVLRQWQLEEAQGKEHFANFRQVWNAELVAKVSRLPGVAGLHVMPLTQAAISLTANLIQQGQLPPRFH